MQSQDIRELLASAIAHHQAGRLDEAEPIYSKILSIVPEHADSLHLSGVIANQRGDYETAIGLIRRALGNNDRVPHFHNNIGIAYRSSDKLDDAERHLRQAITLKPDYAEAHHNLGAVFQKQDKLEAAAAAFLQAIALKHDYAKAYYSLGFIRQKQKKLDEAIIQYNRALELNPSYVEALNNLALVYQEQGKFDEADAHYKKALDVKPTHSDTHYNIGVLREAQGRLDDALECYARTQELVPEGPDAHWNEALIRLLRGEYKRGWEKYEWRFKRDKAPRPDFGKPTWDGADLSGRTLLLQAEQGYGDTIQFIRYAEALKQRGANVIVSCPPTLLTLIETAVGVDKVIAWDETPPPFDFYVPLLSLPKRLAIDVETAPTAVPYLQSSPARVAAWREKLGASGVNVGLVWRGNPDNTINYKKSIPLDALAPLVGVKGVNWSIIQADATADEVAQLAAHGAVEARGPALTDWAETAALVSALDLVISIDTGVAHLAGALGAKLWVPLSFIPDWRWLLDRPDSPWYPTARLYRQPTFGDWPAVIARLKVDLAALAGVS